MCCPLVSSATKWIPADGSSSFDLKINFCGLTLDVNAVSVSAQMDFAADVCAVDEPQQLKTLTERIYEDLCG